MRCIEKNYVTSEKKKKKKKRGNNCPNHNKIITIVTTTLMKNKLPQLSSKVNHHNYHQVLTQTNVN